MSFVIGMKIGHSASFTIARDGVILEVLEYERMSNVKNAPLYYANSNPRLSASLVARYFREKYKAYYYDLAMCIYPFNVEDFKGPRKKHKINLYNKILSYFNAREVINVDHQYSHASSSLYQSNHKEAIIVSVDGGGNDGCFIIYHAVRGEKLKVISKIDINLGSKYNYMGGKVQQIRPEKKGLNQGLVYAGKIMGLAAYGDVNNDWVDHFQDYYLTKKNRRNLPDIWKKKIKEPLSVKGKFSVKDGPDVAATNQYVFEKIFEDKVKPVVDMFPDVPVHFTGGCALNVLNNAKWARKRDIFVTPNPNDCGLSSGAVLDFLKPQWAVDLTYSGPEVFDKWVLPEYAQRDRAEFLDMNELVEDLLQGKIVGIVRGNCEHGPRALGNRSILCNPMIKGMKDILNSKVKGREYFRPFAPVCKYDDLTEYFDWKGEVRWMTFGVPVREGYKKVLTEVTHADGTARIQTVTAGQNPWLFELLMRFKEKSGVGVLINTSFNVAGKPILNTYKDALEVLKTKELDGVVLDNYYIKKK